MLSSICLARECNSRTDIEQVSASVILGLTRAYAQHVLSRAHRMLHDPRTERAAMCQGESHADEGRSLIGVVSGRWV